MTLHKRIPAGAAAALTVVLAGVALGAPPAAATGTGTGTGTTATTGAAGGTGDTVLLVTGDRVRLDANGDFARFLPAEGREGIGATAHRDGDHLFVVPDDARNLVESGVVERQLFDVTELNRPEYDRLADGGLPVIVTYENAAAAAEARADLTAVDGRARVLDETTAAETWASLTNPRAAGNDGNDENDENDGVAGIALDAVRQALLDTSVPQVGAPAAWEAGFDGTGTRIAILDTGIDTSHPDLAGGKVVAEENFSAAADLADRQGHGTHVASIAAGTGAHSGGAFTGVAPGAELLNAKVLDDDGFGLESGILAGMEWAVEQDADVVNLSLGGADAPGVDLLEEAVNRLSAETSTLFVVAAGNSGNQPGTVSSPATAEAALAVGAVDDADALAEFSSAGPVAGGGGLVKPDLTAPGVGIGAAAAEGSAVAEEGEPVADGYVAISGTSMATPHVAGAAALLAQAHPDWDGERLKAALVGSATDPADDAATEMQQGTGRLDVARAIEQTVVAEPVSLDFGTAAWPHEDDEPAVRDLTYRNVGEQDVTLGLTLSTSAPEGMFTLGADEVTVPAGGTATVPVTADTRVGGEATGHFSLTVTATGAATGAGTGAGTEIRTAGAVERAEEVYRLAVEITGDDGNPVDVWSAFAENLDTGDVYWLGEGGNSPAEVMATPGTYALVVGQAKWSPDGEEVIERVRHTVALPDVGADTTVELDNREAEPIDLTVFDEGAEPGGQAFNVRTPTVMEIGSDIDRPLIRTRHIGPDLPADALVAAAYQSWHSGDDTEYHSAFRREGTGFTGLTERVAESDLARVELTQNAVTEGTSGSLWLNAEAYGSNSVSRPLPATTDVYITGGDVPWSFSLSLDGSPNGYEYYNSEPRTYRAGEHTQAAINVPVFGPGLGYWDGFYRRGDVLWGSVGLFTDAAGSTGESVLTSGLTTLTLDGEEIARFEDAGYFEMAGLPAESGRYELSMTAGRAGPLSSEVSVSFGFDSAHVSEEGAERLPLSVVRFTPEVAPDGTAPGGAALTVPVAVQGPADGDVSAEVSFDGGTTWQDAPVADGAFTVENPPAGGTVSLRGSVSGTDGTTSTVTVIDAYRTS
ncbi:S8 family peptidase [Streptomyces johnsoniae]|uniref:S8 family serine peptidase n=1 Tax=Streptomyces johnsoniae TaxID=3075532 RepID=A0ABU2S110_9ACTN|nr:S8 family serine peptidase [Streptomyces sp. DSM 41886]MDT0441449.1 S8 family serine peptidase [Streptomyces sp. DSM 41886]